MSLPSSHSALCTTLTTSVALCHGVADSLFPVSLGFSLIVMYDAIGVRRHAGMQAQVLNMIVQDLFQGHPISQRKLKELLGHTLSQVIAGSSSGHIIFSGIFGRALRHTLLDDHWGTVTAVSALVYFPEHNTMVTFVHSW